MLPNARLGLYRLLGCTACMPLWKPEGHVSTWLQPSKRPRQAAYEHPSGLTSSGSSWLPCLCRVPQMAFETSICLVGSGQRPCIPAGILYNPLQAARYAVMTNYWGSQSEKDNMCNAPQSVLGQPSATGGDKTRRPEVKHEGGHVRVPHFPDPIPSATSATTGGAGGVGLHAHPGP